MYTLRYFDAAPFPQYDTDTDISTGEAKADVIDLSGGNGFDEQGSNQVVPGSSTITFTCSVVEDSRDELWQAASTLRGKLGLLSRLYAEAADGTYVWRYARLVHVGGHRKPKQGGAQPLTFKFISTDAYWRGARHGGPWLLDTGELLDVGLVLDQDDGVFALDASPKTISLANAGNAPCQVGLVEVLAQTSPITSFRLQRDTTIDWTFSGSVAAGKALAVNASSAAVTNDSAAAYAFFTRGTGQKIGPPFEVKPYVTQTFTATWAGGGAGSQGTFTWWDTWA